jgi:hypothetical protein
MKDLIFGLLLLFLACALILWGANVGGRIGCEARWRDSGMAWRHSFAGGCQVQRIDGTWIPDDRYRETEG